MFLYFCVFFGPSFQSSLATLTASYTLPQSWLMFRQQPSRTTSFSTQTPTTYFALLVWLALFVLVWFGGLGGLLLLDTLWAEPVLGLAQTLAYF